MQNTRASERQNANVNNCERELQTRDTHTCTFMSGVTRQYKLTLNEPHAPLNTSTGQPSFLTGATIVPFVALLRHSEIDNTQSISDTYCSGAGAGVGALGLGLGVAPGKQHLVRTVSP